ncbi:MAG: sigma-70 family RNA polymerase sigma factor [Candidatus Omnitrophica bacterium]|nr:sigma-70 family RNA polymerase sigma factor [Candidatus Omnitrophota bacterium]
MMKEERIKFLISRYQQGVFALVLYLIGGDQDKTYDICASSFAEAMRACSSPEREGIFLAKVIGIAVEKARAIKTIPVFKELEFLDLPASEQGPLRLLIKAFWKLAFDDKALVLLREQLNLSYRQIAAVMRKTESDTRSEVNQARTRLREIIEDTLKYE